MSYESKYLGTVTKEELREVYDSEPGIEESIRMWLRESDGWFVTEQMDELMDVIRFETDAWDNVYATVRVSPEDCGMLAEAVRKSIYSYPSTMEPALEKLERYSVGARRVYWDMPEHFERAICEQMEEIAKGYEKCLKAELQWWMDAESDELFANYFLDEPDRWMEDFPDIWEERLERIERQAERKRARRTRRWKRRLFLFKRDRKPKYAMV